MVRILLIFIPGLLLFIYYSKERLLLQIGNQNIGLLFLASSLLIFWFFLKKLQEKNYKSIIESLIFLGLIFLLWFWGPLQDFRDLQLLLARLFSDLSIYTFAYKFFINYFIFIVLMISLRKLIQLLNYLGRVLIKEFFIQKARSMFKDDFY